MIKVIAKPRYRRSKPSKFQIFPRNPRDVTCLSLHPHISRGYKAFRARRNVFTIWKASIQVTCGGRTGAWTDNYPRVPASSSSNPISPRVLVEKGWTVKNSVTIIKTVDMVDPGWVADRIDPMPRRRIVKTFVINCHWLGRCNEPLQTRIKIKERAVVMAGR